MQRQSSTIGGYDTFASEIKQDGNQIGEKEYFERREHDKLHEKLDFIMSQLTRVDRNVKCLALTDGANLALQTMMDTS